ncbi:MAG: hypothetical protein QM662_09220, partial [Gordonia sp. (in: high G+C Gram-positive bacteria)]
MTTGDDNESTSGPRHAMPEDASGTPAAGSTSDSTESGLDVTAPHTFGTAIHSDIWTPPDGPAPPRPAPTRPGPAPEAASLPRSAAP